MKSNLNKKTIIYISILSSLILIISTILLLNDYREKTNGYLGKQFTHFATSPISTSDILKDKNDIHLFYAKRNGLKKPFENDSIFDAEIDTYVRKSILVKVNENGYYKLKSLTHSKPYLIPETVDLMNEIGARFQKRLEEKKYNKYRFRITSLLRTKETQNKLCRRNGNATENTAHLYGTTVDISYKNFYNVKADSLESSYEAVQTLTNVLVEMRKECKFLAVRERKQSCFHLTVVFSRPIK